MVPIGGVDRPYWLATDGVLCGVGADILPEHGDNDDNTQYDEPQKVKVGGITIELYHVALPSFPG